MHMDEQIRISQFKGHLLGARVPAEQPVVAVQGKPLHGGPDTIIKFINVDSAPGGREMAGAALKTAGILLKDFAGARDFWRLRDAGLQGRWLHFMEERTGLLSLREALDLHGPIDALSCVERADPLARMLGELHARGVICGFLNTDNVFLQDDGTFSPGDFLTPAFAYVYNRAAGRRLALVESMAPELLRGEAGDPRADVFALAALIYRAVCGRSPFPDSHDSAAAWDVRGVPVDASLFGLGCNSHFAQVLRWAMAPDPDRRPPTPKRLIMDLRAAALDHDPGEDAARATPHPVEPVPPSPLDGLDAEIAGAQATAWMLRDLGGAPERPRAPRRGAWMAAAALAVILCGGGAYAAWRYLPREAAPPARVAKCPPDMILVPGGRVTLGEDDLPNGVRPRHQETLAGFCIDRYEHPNKNGGAVETGVSWPEAVRACSKQGRRLCSEAEWEAACRGPEGRPYPYGNTYSENICNTAGRGKTAAGLLPGCASPAGALDMIGNAMEWTADRFGGDDGPYALRGGSWKSGGRAQCAARFNPRDVPAAQIGFRCCVDFRD